MQLAEEAASAPLTRKDESKALSIRRIIAAVNPSKKCEATVRYASEIAARYEATLYICYVFWPSVRNQGQPYDSIDREQSEFRHQLEALADQVRGSVPICKSALLSGHPAERISMLAHDVHADLIVTASSDPVVTQLLTADMTMKMPCSVLVYHDNNS